MNTFPFPGGVHPPDYKEPTSTELIEVAEPPQEAVIHLLQHTGAPAAPLVKVKDEVRTGQQIGHSDSFITASVHSSITGTVVAVEPRPHPVYGESKAVVVANSGFDMIDYKPMNRNWQDLQPADIISYIRQAGVVGLGGAAFPTHLKLTPPPDKKIDVLLINGAECEPFLTSDDRLMRERAEEVVEGIRILKRATGATQVIVVIEDNKQLSISSMTQALRKLEDSLNPISLCVIPTRYPQGSEKQMIYSVTGKEVPSGGLPVDIGVIVQNVGTAFAVFEAVVRNKPLYERVVTVTGDCVENPGNFVVRIGTPFRQLVETAGGLSKEPVKIISGGPMMGIAQYTLESAVVKGTSGIVLMSAEMAKVYEPSNCIRCGFCISHCPQQLMPQMIMKLATKEKWTEIKYQYNLMDCMECGCCAYSCPAKIPLVQWIKLAKYKTRMLKI
ncbi:MAG: electron transport complex subunit RsxC [Firmicutes bacterium]|nr:electron transport complex subunit RsxC [Bacillota bacterium]